MDRNIKIFGSENGTSVTIDVDGMATDFSLSGNISAEKLFQALDFKPGSNYILEKGANNGIQKKPFDSFTTLVENILNELNSIEVEGSSTEKGSETEADNPSISETE